MQLLNAQNLHKSYTVRGKSLTAVRDVSLQLSAGDVLAFLGPNGAGKTTTIKMIAGLIRPDRGSVRILDRDPHSDSRTLGLLGAVLEGSRNLYWRLTPEENLEYFGVLHGLTRREARRRGRQLLDRFELTHKRKSVIQELSRGMQQKVAIAVALVHDPQLLLLDEPTLGLDVEATETVKRLVREIVQEGRAILLTTHQLNVAEELSDRVAIINQGTIVAEKSTRELIHQFSGSTYQIELEHPLDLERMSKLEMLGLSVESTRVHLKDPTLLYPALDILRPLPIIKIDKEIASLTDVFLQVVNQNRHV